MVRHLVLFKLKDFSSESERSETLSKVLNNFRSLIGEIPQIRSYRVHADVVRGSSSYDVIIDSTFDNLEDLKAYQAHPAHQEAVQRNKAWSQAKVVGDYIIEK